MKRLRFFLCITFFLFSSLIVAQNYKTLDFVEFPEGSFVIGQDVQNYTANRYVKSFLLNKYETTYELWFSVKKQAESIGYTFNNPGQEGSRGRRGRSPKKEGLPVTMINWYDAIIWCNAFSEISGKTPCYTYKGKVLKDSSNTALCDLCTCDFSANGYRLPTEAEWEYAARYSDFGFLLGNRASGSLSEDEDLNYSWTSENTYETKPVGTTGSVFTNDVQIQIGSGTSNKAGIFDMSGNVLEYCWDWFTDYTEQEKDKIATGPSYGSKRVCRGGSFSEYTMFIFSSDRYSFDPNECYDYIGFRLARSK